MKYLSDLFKVTFFVLIMYMPVVIIDYTFLIKEGNREFATKIYSKADQIQNEIQDILSKNDILEACQKLEAHITALNIASYIIVGPETSCYKPEDMNQLPPQIDINSSKVYNVKNINLTFFRKKTNRFDWSVSVVTPEKLTLAQLLKMNNKQLYLLFKDFLLGVYIILIFGLFAVLILAESIQNTFRQKGQDPLWLRFLNKTFGHLQLHDLKMIKSASGALVKKNKELLEDIDLLETSLEYSILNEIKKNNHKVPYTFYGTVAKVDINGYSKVVSAGFNQTVKEMTTRLEDFGCELLQRYDGLFEKTIGDEIVVVFKGDHSVLRALAFSRDLMNEYSKLIFKIDSEERSFTLKSSIYSSDITFLKRPSGYGFTGDALTYTTRLMETVKDKNHNILSVLKKQDESISELIQIPETAENFHFKNMSEQQGYHILEFYQFDKILNQKKHLTEFFKSDSHILVLLEKLKSKAQTENQNTQDFIQALSKINVRQASAQVIESYLDLLNNLTASQLTHRQMSHLIILSINLIPKKQWNTLFTNALLNIPRNLEGRINASIIEVLMHHELYALNDIDQTTFIIANDPSGRTQSNLIVLNALNEPKELYFEEFLKMIKSPYLHISKSGIYGACQVISYYKQKNPALLETFETYKKVEMLIKQLRQSSRAQFSTRLQEKMLSI